MKKGKKILIITLLTTILLLMLIVYIKEPRYFNPNLWATRNNVKKFIEKEMKKDYGEEFKVLFIAKRGTESKTWYEGKVVLKKKIGTEEEQEFTFGAGANTKKGIIENGGGGYSGYLLEKNIEEFFQPKLNEIFGNKIKISHRIHYKIYNENNEMKKYTVYDENFKKSVEKVKSDPRNSMELVQWLYIFEDEKKIDNIEEYKEKIFKYKEYLDKEGLLNFMDVIIFLVNDRVLLNGYTNLFRKTIKNEENRKLDESRDAYYAISKSSQEKFIDEVNKLKKKELSYNINKKINNLKTKDYIIKGDNTLNLYNSKYIIDIKELKFVKRKSYIELSGGN